ncbi:AraC family ligand binding domain-containing protein [Parasutterella excrementihominis]|uniref:AraC family ligand binding domain-containing protein n=2 Tax=Parasutterella excrementihominis TaxID=487175 RepID=UPI0025AF2164|nr:AraC family ligand binding domain-containing protein [Parasutterella excrementihominis]
METISRTIRHDEVLGLEAFCLQGYAQPFPRHFHDYYVLGFVVSGERKLLCNGLNLQVFPGNLLIFNPRENHECVSTSRAPFLHYLGFNILKKRMEEISIVKRQV